MPPKKKTKNEPSTEILNFYDLKKVKEHMTKSINPHYNIHHIKVPFRAILIGSSGSGKTNCLMNIINVMQSTFNHIYVYTQAEEPIYSFLQEELGRDMLTISYGGLDKLRAFEEKRYYGQSLVIFDDMCNEKDQKAVQELFIRGRKIAGGVSLLYLTQSYYKVPKLVRLQSQYIFILKVSGKRDLNMILSEYSLGATKEQLFNMYNYVCNNNNFGHFFLIDLDASQDRTYRQNFDKIMDASMF